jgi:tRNA (Thr-GGU) A37 N-methylase
LRRKEAVLWVRGIDVIDGTPLLDIKPYVPAFDYPGPARSGWLEGKGGHAATARADTRFAPQRQS